MTTTNPSQLSSQTPGTPGSPDPHRGTAGTHRSAAVVGGLCIFVSVALLAGGGVIQAADQRLSQDGFLTSVRMPMQAPGYAVATDEDDLSDDDPLPTPEWLLGGTRIRVTNGDPSTPVFVGIGRADDVTGYLSGVQHSVLTEIIGPATAYEERDGGAPASRPGDADFWVTEAEGPGTQTLDWAQEEGSWRVAVMNADGSSGVNVNVDVGAQVPSFGNIGRWSMLASLPFAAAGLGLIIVFLRRRARDGSR